MNDHKPITPSPRQQAVEVLAVTLLEILLHDVRARDAGQRPRNENASVEIRSLAPAVRIH